MTIEYNGEIDISLECSKCGNDIDYDISEKRGIYKVKASCHYCENELQSKIDELNETIEKLNEEIEAIKATEIFTTIISNKL